MVVVGADVHKRTHTFVAVDEVGRKLGEKVVAATGSGHAEAVMWVRERFGTEVVWAIEDCRHLELADITRLTEAIDALGKRIGDRVRQVAPTLAAMPGCGELTAAKLLGETATVTRFKSEAAFARHAGVAPIPVWSGNTAGRVRMTRSGNRQINAALHRIAVTQIRLNGLGQAYYRKRLHTGASNREALRSLKRRLARIVFNNLHTDHQNRTRSCQPAAA